MRIFHSHLIILYILILANIHVSSELHHVLLIIVCLVIIIYKWYLILHSLNLKVKLITRLIEGKPLILLWWLKLVDAHIGELIDIILIHLAYLSNLGGIHRSWILCVVVGLSLRVPNMILNLLHFILAVLLVIISMLRYRETYLLSLVIFIHLFILNIIFLLAVLNVSLHILISI